MLFTFRPSFAIALWSTVTLLGCSGESEPSRPLCPPAGPSFRVTIEAEGEALPEDIRIEISYGAGHEVYRLDDATRAGKSVFCEPLPDAENVETIVCELWTSGAAGLEISAEGYEPIDETLSAERDDCGIVLVEVSRKLERAEESPIADDT